MMNVPMVPGLLKNHHLVIITVMVHEGQEVGLQSAYLQWGMLQSSGLNSITQANCGAAER